MREHDPVILVGQWLDPVPDPIKGFITQVSTQPSIHQRSIKVWSDLLKMH